MVRTCQACHKRRGNGCMTVVPYACLKSMPTAINRCNQLRLFYHSDAKPYGSRSIVDVAMVVLVSDYDTILVNTPPPPPKPVFFIMTRVRKIAVQIHVSAVDAKRPLAGCLHAQ